MSDLDRTIQNAIETGTPIPLQFQSKVPLVINITGAAAATDFIQHAVVPFTGTLVEAWISVGGAATGTAGIGLFKSDSGTTPGSGTRMTEDVDISLAGDQFDVKAMPIISAAAAVTKGQLLGLIDSGAIAGTDDVTVTLVFQVTQF